MEALSFKDFLAGHLPDIFAQAPSIGQVAGIFGEPQDSCARKKQSFMRYGALELMFIDDLLRQITLLFTQGGTLAGEIPLSVTDIPANIVLNFDYFRDTYYLSPKDEVLPFFRSFAIPNANGHEVLVNFSPQAGNTLISAAVVLPEADEDTYPVSLSLTQEEYRKVCALADRERIPVEDICHNIIKNHLIK